MTLPNAKVIPELYVSDLDTSLAFYVQLLGFSVGYARPDERFAFLDLDSAQLMLQEATAPSRRLLAGTLERPYGRGINLQIWVQDADALLARVTAAGIAPLVAMEERWYRAGSTYIGQRQFVVGDPDGYLLRFARSLGTKG